MAFTIWTGWKSGSGPQAPGALLPAGAQNRAGQDRGGQTQKKCFHRASPQIQSRFLHYEVKLIVHKYDFCVGCPSWWLLHLSVLRQKQRSKNEAVWKQDCVLAGLLHMVLLLSSVWRVKTDVWYKEVLLCFLHVSSHYNVTPALPSLPWWAIAAHLAGNKRRSRKLLSLIQPVWLLLFFGIIFYIYFFAVVREAEPLPNVTNLSINHRQGALEQAPPRPRCRAAAVWSAVRTVTPRWTS